METTKRELQSTQLILYFSLGQAPFVDNDPRMAVHSRVFDEIDAVLKDDGAALIPGWEEADPTVSPEFRHYPYELCEDDFLFSDDVPEVCVTFYRGGSREFAEATALALRDFCLQKYQEAAGDVAVRFSRAERFQHWSLHETSAWPSLS